VSASEGTRQGRYQSGRARLNNLRSIWEKASSRLRIHGVRDQCADIQHPDIDITREGRSFKL
jgi:hypothetical protein